MKAANKQYVFIVLYAFASSFEAVNKILNLKSYSVKASESAKNESFFFLVVSIISLQISAL